MKLHSFLFSSRYNVRHLKLWSVLDDEIPQRFHDPLTKSSMFSFVVYLFFGVFVNVMSRLVQQMLSPTRSHSHSRIAMPEEDIYIDLFMFDDLFRAMERGEEHFTVDYSYMCLFKCMADVWSEWTIEVAFFSCCSRVSGREKGSNARRLIDGSSAKSTVRSEHCWSLFPPITLFAFVRDDWDDSIVELERKLYKFDAENLSTPNTDCEMNMKQALILLIDWVS